MVELAYLGSLLGMPNIFDPMFTLAASAFLSSLPPGLEEGETKEEQPEDKPAAIHTSNVSRCFGATHDVHPWLNLCENFENVCTWEMLHAMALAA